MNGGKDAQLVRFPEGETELQKNLFICVVTDPESVWEERLPAKEQELRDFATASRLAAFEIVPDRDVKNRYLSLRAMSDHKIKGMQ